ncbi:uncharacterized protein LOC135125684 [Zophobas morio]|uniref:uncharacterized protein LOC135125684 n=1 Tax=Zophobas morio TaxID=2755281 RepID=UPI0030832C20
MSTLSFTLKVVLTIEYFHHKELDERCVLALSKIFKHMAAAATEITICRSTRRNLRYILLWPNINEELEPGNSYTGKIVTHVFITAAFPLCVLIHVITTKTRNLDVPVVDNISVLASLAGTYYMSFIYTKNQSKVARLLKEMSSFENFGKPPNFDQKEQVLNFFSTFFFVYISVGIVQIKHLNQMICEAFDNTQFEISQSRLTNCIFYHVDIIRMAKTLDEIFSNAMFTHTCITAIICACIEKQFVEGDRLCAILHFSGWILTLTFACCSGQILINACESISESIWSSKWYEADVRLQKDILFMLRRSQTIFFLTAGPFSSLSFPLLVSVKLDNEIYRRMINIFQAVKMSYSLLCLLTS